MKAKRTILVGVDGSEAGRQALGWAIEEAGVPQAREVTCVGPKVPRPNW
jgi:nucleotide-binding universal stress UspA family protein